jgi:precorrin-6Y C5,15-methyltransferase (decarboxylating)
LIGQADILVGGRRHLSFFKDHPAEKRIIDKDLARLLGFLRQAMQTATIVVLASGDPLFHGIGATLIQSLGKENVEVLPNISTVAAAFARLKLPWQDATVVSLHGAGSPCDFLHAVRQKSKVAVYTDPHHHPGQLARLLLENGLTEAKICVLEQLGSISERIQWGRPDQMAEQHFSEPNLMIVLNPACADKPPKPLAIGLPDDAYEHEKGLITKAEVRAVTLSKLRLHPGQILWDLGAGSGSISIEASLFIGSGQIFAIEKDRKRAAQIASNCRRFGVGQVKVCSQVLPRGLDALPAPDRVFIGGGGRQVAAIISKVAEFLKPGGIMVINTVLLDTLKAAQAALKELEFACDLVQIQINRSRPMPWGERLVAQNPVWIIAATRKGK